MDVLEQLHNELLEARANGATNQDIAEKGGISRSHINAVLNGSHEIIGSLKFATVLRLFPIITNLLTEYYQRKGTIGSPSVSGNGNAVATHNSTATVSTLPASDARLDTLMAQILDSQMCDTCKLIALNFILKEKQAENK